MSPFDGYPDEMRDPLDDTAVDAILSGRSAGADERLDALNEAVGEIRSAYAVSGTPRPGPELAEMLTTGLATDKGDRPATVGSNAHGPAPQVAGLPNWRNRPMVRNVLGTVPGKIAAALPASAQSAVARAVDTVGVHLPEPGHHRQGTGDHKESNGGPASSIEDHGHVATPASTPPASAPSRPSAHDDHSTAGDDAADPAENEGTEPTENEAGDTHGGTTATTQPHIDGDHGSTSTTTPGPEGEGDGSGSHDGHDIQGGSSSSDGSGH